MLYYRIGFLSLCLLSGISAWADQARLSVKMDNTLAFEFVRIPAGSFEMGDAQGQRDEQPLHNVTLSAFYLQSHELTRQQYAVFAKDHALAKGCWYFDGKNVIKSGCLNKMSCQSCW